MRRDVTFVAGTALAGLILAVLQVWYVALPAERAERLRSSGRANIVCPTCGYNLTGLTNARCPECGGQFTLDELLAAQPARADAEVE